MFMKIKNMARALYPFVVGVSLFAVSFFLLAGSAYAADFSASFSPAADAVEQDATVNITISFDRAIYADTDDTVFAADTLGDVVSLHATNASGAAIPFGASISADNRVITVDPTSDLPTGAVYVAISDGYYDADDVQGDAASAIFFIAAAPAAPGSGPTIDVPDTPAPEAPGSGPTVDAPDTTAPTVTMSPADGTTITDNTQDITLTFSEAVSKDASGTAFADADLAGILTVKSTDASGTDIAYTATINAGNDMITIDPTDNLADGAVYVAITDGYYDAAGNQGSAANVSFTVAAPDTTAPTVTMSPADGTTITDNTQDITLTFSEAVSKDASGTAFADADLAGILTVKSTDASGTDIAYTATINAGNDMITIDPTDNLADGAVYVAITDGYYDAAGNQGSAANVSFTVAFLEEFVVTSSPADQETVTDNAIDISLTFNRPVYRDRNGTEFTTKELASFVVLRTDDVYGYAIPFEAQMDDTNTVITIDPTDSLVDGGVYVAISGDYYDADENRGVAFDATFTVDTGTPPAVQDFFSHLLLLSPIFSSDGPLKAPTLSVEPDEVLRQQKILETVSLLWQALESLSIVAAMDSGADVGAPATSVSNQPSTADGGDDDDEEEGEVTEVGPDAVLPEQSPAAE